MFLLEEHNVCMKPKHFKVWRNRKQSKIFGRFIDPEQERYPNHILEELFSSLSIAIPGQIKAHICTLEPISNASCSIDCFYKSKINPIIQKFWNHTLKDPSKLILVAVKARSSWNREVIQESPCTEGLHLGPFDRNNGIGVLILSEAEP